MKTFPLVLLLLYNLAWYLPLTTGEQQYDHGNRVIQSEIVKGMECRNQLIRNLTKDGLSEAEAVSQVKIIIERGKLSKQTSSSALRTVQNMCENPPVVCGDTSLKIRTISGQCNNLKKPQQGRSYLPLARYLPPEYDDNIGEPRGGNFNINELNQGGRSGGCGGISNRLPLTRTISTNMFPDYDVSSPLVTHMFTNFGQFLAHDLSKTAESSVLNCCTDPSQMDCFPIPVATTDPFYSTRKKPQKCLQMARSLQFCPGTGGVREQFNELTSYLDASLVYGSTDDEMIALRSFTHGKLLTDPKFPDKEMLPVISGKMSAGDPRALEWPGLVAMHTIFLREHNRLASDIYALFPTMEDEEIFQIGRKLLIAEWENIIYNEYLPLVVGNKGMTFYKLWLNETEYTDYDPEEDATVRNSFTNVAFRFAHSMIQGFFWMLDPAEETEKEVFRLKDHYWNPSSLTANNGIGIDRVLLGLINQPSRAPGQFYTKESTDFLFPVGKMAPPVNGTLPDFGGDLLALDVQRGRDHGFAGYNKWRKFCGLPVIPSLSESSKPAEISQFNWEILRRLYKSVNDIDFFPASIVETPVEGGTSGPTMTCIIAKQFYSSLKGDRFFFTHGGDELTFSSEQLAAIKKRTLRDIICQNTDIREARLRVFEVASPVQPCSTFNPLDVKLFT